MCRNRQGFIQRYVLTLWVPNLLNTHVVSLSWGVVEARRVRMESVMPVSESPHTPYTR